MENENPGMVHEVVSAKSVQEIERAFPLAAVKHKFGVGVHNLRQKMNEKGVPFERDCLVFEVCNPQQAKKVLEGEMSLSTALPWRVSVYQSGGKTRLATLRPTALLDLFGKPELSEVGREVEEALFKIMDEAAS